MIIQVWWAVMCCRKPALGVLVAPIWRSEMLLGKQQITSVGGHAQAWRQSRGEQQPSFMVVPSGSNAKSPSWVHSLQGIGMLSGTAFPPKNFPPRAAVRSDALLVPTAVATEGCIPLYPVGWCCRNYEHCAEPLHQPGGLSRFLVCLHLFTPKKGLPTACTALLGVSFHLIYDLEPTTGEAISWWFNPERNMHIAFL